MASASWASNLVLLPWTAFMARACPRTKAIPSVAQRSASQYQEWTHSLATTRSGRKGVTAARKASGRAG